MLPKKLVNLHIGLRIYIIFGKYKLKKQKQIERMSTTDCDIPLQLLNHHIRIIVLDQTNLLIYFLIFLESIIEYARGDNNFYSQPCLRIKNSVCVISLIKATHFFCILGKYCELLY